MIFSLITMILLISFLVLVHEAGHFFAARAFKIKVSKFGFGLPIGPTLWSKKIGDVEVLVHSFLLGGYVSFPDDEKDSDIPLDSEERFSNKPVWQRMVVISAGVIANILTAIFFVVLTATLWGKLPTGGYEVYVHKIASDKNPTIEASGIKKGDRIYRINNSLINSNYALTLFAQNSKPYDGKIDEDFYEINLKRLEQLNPDISSNMILKKSASIKLPKTIDEYPLLIDDNALKGYKLYYDKQLNLNDLQKNIRNSIKDKIEYSANGSETLKDIAMAISDSKRPINITVLRNGKEINLKPVYSNEQGIIGVALEMKQILQPTKNPLQIITKSVSYLWEQTYMLVYGLYQLFTGKIPMKDLHGIVVITKIGGDVIHNSGFFSGLLLTAMISLDLALVNFLPIPALDGGHFMFLLIEKLRGKPVDETVINKVSTIFFVLLLIFMVLIVFNDIYALVSHKL